MPTSLMKLSTRTAAGATRPRVTRAVSVAKLTVLIFSALPVDDPPGVAGDLRQSGGVHDAGHPAAGAADPGHGRGHGTGLGHGPTAGREQD